MPDRRTDDSRMAVARHPELAGICLWVQDRASETRSREAQSPGCGSTPLPAAVYRNMLESYHRSGPKITPQGGGSLIRHQVS